MKFCAEVRTQADYLRNVGDAAAVIFGPSKHLQNDLHFTHMPGCKQAASTKCHKVVIGLWKCKEA